MTKLSLHIDPQSPTPLYSQLVSQIENLIRAGELPPDSPLPSVRHLAEQIEINSLTVQKAYKILASDGLITIRKGVGASVSSEVRKLSVSEKKKQIKEQLTPPIKQAKSFDWQKNDFQQLVTEIWES